MANALSREPIGPHNRLRRLGREVIHFEAVPRIRLEPELEAFLEWFNGSLDQVNGLLRAGTAHLWFVTLHPFEDGNGRIGRALTDMAVAQDNHQADGLFRMSSRILNVRKAYYDALQKAQRHSSGLDITTWLAWFLAQVAEASRESERIIQRTLAKAKFWSMHHDDGLNPRQRKALNRLLEAGPGGFEGGMTARKYQGLTHASKPSATRDLAELLARGCLVQTGAGPSTAYALRWDQLLPCGPDQL